ncbi:MAG TPA: GNAT family N-acetyltransferase [Beijerinckiaceae bacterium]|jgi:phosphinothricin acetyltransferase
MNDQPAPNGLSRPAGTLKIRPTAEADLPAVQAIYAHHVLTGAATFEIEPPDLEDIHGRWSAIVAGGYPHLVAVEGGTEVGRILGYAYAGAYRPRPAYRHAVEDSVYVDAKHHGRGIGRALLQRLVHDCERRGFRQMVAVIGDNAPASVALHAALGFTEAGRMRAVGWKFGRWCDTTLMQRPLGPGDGAPP